ncbi:MAG TPA: DUF1269 domain-containing protein [Acidimicrobiales bacterium]|nr:DUF1269 domain-containing protein [Acidimicrobiales bacterium]
MAKNLSTTVGVYTDQRLAEQDWDAIEASAKSGGIDLADAALVRRNLDGNITTLRRQSHHGWGKGAIAGAMVGLIFPPSLIGSAVVGAAGGGIVAKLSRKVKRDDIKDLGDAMDEGDVDLLVITDSGSVKALVDLMEGATKTLSKDSATAEEVREALNTSDISGSSTAGSS